MLAKASFIEQSKCVMFQINKSRNSNIIRNTGAEKDTKNTIKIQSAKSMGQRIWHGEMGMDIIVDH